MVSGRVVGVVRGGVIRQKVKKTKELNSISLVIDYKDFLLCPSEFSSYVWIDAAVILLHRSYTLLTITLNLSLSQ